MGVLQRFDFFGLGSTTPALPVPTITGFLPMSGARGSTVVITGTNLLGATVVSINSGAVAPGFVVDSATQITAVLTNAQTSGLVRVITPGGTATSSSPFTVTTVAPAVPTITSFTPSSGAVGSTVTVTGTNLSGATAATMGGVAAARGANMATSLVLTVPVGGTGTITVTTPNGTATSTGAFTVTVPATGEEIVLTDAHFSEDVYKSAQVGYTKRSPFARVSGIATNSATLSVQVHRLGGNATAFAVYVNGSFFNSYQPAGTGLESIAITGLPTGQKTIELVGSATLASGSYDFTGTSFVKLVFAAGSTNSVANAVPTATLIVVDGDSIDVSANATLLPRDGQWPLTRLATGYQIGLTAWAGKSACAAYPTTILQNAQAQRVVDFLAPATKRIYWHNLGTNDYGLSTGSPAQYAAIVGAIFDRINQLDPSIIIYARTPLYRVGETTPNGVGYTKAQYKDALQDVCAARTGYVIYVDASAWLVEADLDSADWLHPTTSGQAKLKDNNVATLAAVTAPPKLTGSSLFIDYQGLQSDGSAAWNTAYVNTSLSIYEPSFALATQGAGVKYAFTFEGTQFRLRYNNSSSGQVQRIKVDGVEIALDDQRTKRDYTSPVMAQGRYLVEVESTTTTGYIYFERIEAPGGFFVVPLPTISGLSKTSELVRYPLTITGSNFRNLTSVVFGGGATATVISSTATSIVVTIPDGAATGPITVTTPVGSVQSAAFTVATPTPTYSVAKVMDDDDPALSLLGGAGWGQTTNANSPSGHIAYNNTEGSYAEFNQSFEQFSHEYYTEENARDFQVKIDGVVTVVMPVSSATGQGLRKVTFVTPRVAPGMHNVRIERIGGDTGYQWIGRIKILTGNNYAIGLLDRV